MRPRMRAFSSSVWNRPWPHLEEVSVGEQGKGGGSGCQRVREGVPASAHVQLLPHQPPAPCPGAPCRLLLACRRRRAARHAACQQWSTTPRPFTLCPVYPNPGTRPQTKPAARTHELDLDLLQRGALGLGEQGLAQGHHALLGARARALHSVVGRAGGRTQGEQLVQKPGVSRPATSCAPAAARQPNQRSATAGTLLAPPANCLQPPTALSLNPPTLIMT